MLDDPDEVSAARAALLDQLTERLASVETIALAMRASLVAADAAAIEAATARVSSIALEFKLLTDEYRRLPGDGAGDPDVDRARGGLEAAATRLARSAALSGGLLERMATLRRGLLALLSSATGGTYLQSGCCSDLRAEGVRVRESA